MDLENMVLSEVSQTERKVLECIAYMWNLKQVQSVQTETNGGYQGNPEGPPEAPLQSCSLVQSGLSWPILCLLSTNLIHIRPGGIFAGWRTSFPPVIADGLWNVLMYMQTKHNKKLQKGVFVSH